MKLAKALYFFAFLLAINIFAPGSNYYVQAKSDSSGKGGNSLAQKIKRNKAAFISTLLTTIALAAGTAYGAIHYHKYGTFANLFGFSKSRKPSSGRRGSLSRRSSKSGPSKKGPILTSISDDNIPINIEDLTGTRTPSAPYTVKLSRRK
ncbi:early transcribed membrane protein [Plasmodium chabaudi chabaudi]|uniref:Early transcribed membrane protein n=1 Tax=Plasmodium chabaudi chabaudi TaxID=31271 RepID=A0A077XA95_PLACU|nr:early transcribed membrane protein [Plasmodium chabaudi chabaudi]SCL99839.1 early transcribed membrane protein [Plasmodium chabaudi chabaudi]SCM01102.1 early transcribed membrane protein [Plasmodium chabaudi chabaudi]VTZ67580.1 early transcribed membrane protein [Plasmodium chabaudi chabaudi]|eukprot:XP_745678.2 early transcribed membrane protein [Plasmodium chabaudi chabaudi]